MTWCLAVDSSCNFRDFQPQSPAQFFFAPLTIHVGDREYADDSTLDVEAFLDAVAQEERATSSSCPSVGDWAEIFRQADQVIAITISSGVSGSYEAALMARKVVLEEDASEASGAAQRKIAVIDSRAAGAKLEVLVTMIDRYLMNNPSFEDAVSYAERLEAASQVLYSLSSYENLTKNGRMPKLVGTLASRFGIRLLGTADEVGKLKVVGPTRGERKMYRKVLDVMEADGYHGGMVFIDHVHNAESAQKLSEAIKERWSTAEVSCMTCGGLCSYYAEESGLIIGYEWL
ncbi:DegV family protein [Collinsella sp. AGMB00827]|uniref:DegV family protein n=1 Tax=Collinsella ureilytica TaxID=2869515 RepID=A0ABS7MKV6_9ACTN|nr:DegV family protein [Collinsella urealyticum]MBY4798003.1 DegV family protein [Collinsella urealyticum]